MWDLPGPGLDPVCPALPDGFLTTAPPGKSMKIYFLKDQIITILGSAGYMVFFTTTQPSEEGGHRLHVKEQE